MTDTRVLIFAEILLSAWLASVAFAGDNPVVVGKNVLAEGTEYVEDWYICGPFPTGGLSTLENDWDSYPTEKKAARCLSQKYGGKKGNVSWRRQSIESLSSASADPHTNRVRHLETRAVNLLRAYKDSSIGSSAYALALVETSSPTTRTLLTGSDDGIHIWLNGNRILEVDRERPLVPDEDFSIARLRKGLNVLLIRVDNNAGYWGFSCRFSPLHGATPSLPQDITQNSLFNTNVEIRERY